MFRYTFRVYKLVPGTTCTFRPVEVVTEAPGFAEAIRWLDAEHPGHGVMEHLRGLWRGERLVAEPVDAAGSNPATAVGSTPTRPSEGP